jgi:Bacterial regulatory proteins, tetR family
MAHPGSCPIRLIVEAARQEFQANGYEATSIAAAAERAGVSTKTPSYRQGPSNSAIEGSRGCSVEQTHPFGAGVMHSGTEVGPQC